MITILDILVFIFCAFLIVVFAINISEFDSVSKGNGDNGITLSGARTLVGINAFLLTLTALIIVYIVWFRFLSGRSRKNIVVNINSGLNKERITPLDINLTPQGQAYLRNMKPVLAAPNTATKLTPILSN